MSLPRGQAHYMRPLRMAETFGCGRKLLKLTESLRPAYYTAIAKRMTYHFVVIGDCSLLSETW